MKQIVTKLVELELVGIDGNAFSIMGAFKNAARKQKCPASEIEAVLKEAMSGDYDHLLSTIVHNTSMPEEDFEEEE